VINPIRLTLLGKAATDNGFDLAGSRDGAWLRFASGQTSLRIWLGVLAGSLYLVAFSRREVCAALPDLGAGRTRCGRALARRGAWPTWRRSIA